MSLLSAYCPTPLAIAQRTDQIRDEKEDVLVRLIAFLFPHRLCRSLWMPVQRRIIERTVCVAHTAILSRLSRHCFVSSLGFRSLIVRNDTERQIKKANKTIAFLQLAVAVC